MIRSIAGDIRRHAGKRIDPGIAVIMADSAIAAIAIFAAGHEGIAASQAASGASHRIIARTAAAGFRATRAAGIAFITFLIGFQNLIAADGFVKTAAARAMAGGLRQKHSLNLPRLTAG